jgi:hypothetical protein
MIPTVGSVRVEADAQAHVILGPFEAGREVQGLVVWATATSDGSVLVDVRAHTDSPSGSSSSSGDGERLFPIVNLGGGLVSSVPFPTGVQVYIPLNAVFSQLTWLRCIFTNGDEDQALQAVAAADLTDRIGGEVRPASRI